MFLIISYYNFSMKFLYYLVPLLQEFFEKTHMRETELQNVLKNLYLRYRQMWYGQISYHYFFAFRLILVAAFVLILQLTLPQTNAMVKILGLFILAVMAVGVLLSTRYTSKNKILLSIKIYIWISYYTTSFLHCT